MDLINLTQFNIVEQLISKVCPAILCVVFFVANFISWRKEMEREDLRIVDSRLSEYGLISFIRFCLLDMLLLFGIADAPSYVMIPVAVALKLAMEIARKKWSYDEDISLADKVSYVIGIIITLAMSVGLIFAEFYEIFTPIPIFGTLIQLCIIKLSTTVLSVLVEVVLIRRDYKNVVDVISDEIADGLFGGSLSSALKTIFPDYDFKRQY